MLYALGNGNAGLSLFVQDDRLVLDYNDFGDHTVVESDGPLPAGPSVLGVRFRRTGSGATATLVVDDAPVAQSDIPFAMLVTSSVGSTIGYDHGLPVSDRYDGPFPSKACSTTSRSGWCGCPAPKPTTPPRPRAAPSSAASERSAPAAAGCESRSTRTWPPVS